MDRAMGSLHSSETGTITRSCDMTEFGDHPEISGHMVDLIGKYYELYYKLNQQGLIILPKYKERFCSLMTRGSVDETTLSTLVAEMEESAKPIVQVEVSPKVAVVEYLKRACKKTDSEARELVQVDEISGNYYNYLLLRSMAAENHMSQGTLRDYKRRFCSATGRKPADLDGVRNLNDDIAKDIAAAIELRERID